MTGVQLTLGYEVAFDFAGSSVTTLAPGGYVLVAENRDAMVSRYGSGISAQIAGELSGELDHGSERICLRDYLDQTIVDFTYSDSGAWPGRADGNGSSLEVVSTAGDYNDPDNWRSSSEYMGSPGRAGAGPITNVVVNEVLSNADSPLHESIELYNTTSTAINIGGWYISDTSYDYKKYRISDGTVLAPHQYLVITDQQFASYFVLSSLGDDVWLLEADATGNLTYFADHVEFGAAKDGESFGRWPNATGILYPMLNRTFGQANDYGGNSPRIGPLLISELMYHPSVSAGQDADDYEYIEIFNPTSAAVDLSNWQIQSGVDFTFASGTTIAAHSTLLVLPFDPSDPLNDLKLASFKTKYGIGSSLTLVGGFKGHLANEGETVDLLDAGGVLEDEISYDDAAPWPTAADGGGSSLQRVSTASWGDDAASWIAAAPAPGSAMMVALAGDWTTSRQTLKIDPSDGLLHLYQSGTTTNVVPPCALADITSVDITGCDNIDDVLTIDFSNGNPIPAGGLIFDGGAFGSGSGNSLVINGTSGNDSVSMSAAQITVNGSAPISYSNTAFFSFLLGSGSDNLLISDNATLKINQDNAISAGTDVTINGGTLDLNGKTDTIDNLLLESGSLVNGTLYANAYIIESGTATANIVGPGSLQKTTAAQATAGAISTPNVTLGAGELTVTSINTGTLTLSPGTTLSIAAIPGGPSANRVLRPLATRSIQPILPESASQPAVADAAAQSADAQSTAVQSGAAQASSAAAGEVNAEPQGVVQSAAIDAVVQSSPAALDATTEAAPAPSMVPAMPATTTGQSATTATSLNSLSNAIIDVVAAPAVIVADMDQPAFSLESSTPARPIGTANYRLPPQTPLYSQLNSTAFYGIVESRLQNPLVANPITEARTTVFSASHDDTPLPAALNKRRYAPAAMARLAHFAAFQAIVENADADVDIDVTPHAPGGKHPGQLEKAVEAALAEDEDVFPLME